MRRLIIMRHAKSSWKDKTLEDHARPLNKRGRADSPRMAHALAERGWRPDLILSSDAQRTRETWALMAPTLAPQAPVRWLSSLYMGGAEEVREALRDAPDEARTILLLGHNPGWEELVTSFTGRAVRITTANAALLAAEAASWAVLVEEVEGWSLLDVLRPKHLG
jgi:phosphohistidine phosphatase